MQLSQIKNKPEKLWINYILERLKKQGIVESLDDFKFLDVQSNVGRALQYSLDSSKYWFYMEVSYDPNTNEFIEEYIDITENETDDSYGVQVKKEYAIFHAFPQGVFNEYLQNKNPDKEEELRQKVIEKDGLDELLGHGLEIEPKPIIDKFLDMFITNYKK